MTARKPISELQRRGPKVKGPPWETLGFCMRSPLYEKIKAAALAEGVSPSQWLRWVSRRALASGARMGPAAKNTGDNG